MTPLVLYIEKLSLLKCKSLILHIAPLRRSKVALQLTKGNIGSELIYSVHTVTKKAFKRINK